MKPSPEEALARLEIETPSWGYGDSGTRFATFQQPGRPRDVFERLADAAEVLSPHPAALQLRYLQTLTEVGVNQNSTIVFPLPLDVIRPFLEAVGSSAPRPAGESLEPGEAQPAIDTAGEPDGLLPAEAAKASAERD